MLLSTLTYYCLNNSLNIFGDQQRMNEVKQEEKSLKETKCLLTNVRLRGKYRVIGILQIIKKSFNKNSNTIYLKFLDVHKYNNIPIVLIK